MTEKSESFFNRTLEAKTSEARKAVDECIKQYLAASNSSRKPSADTAFAAVDLIVQMLHETDRPGWLVNIHRDLNTATNHSSDNNGVAALQRITSEHFPKMLRHKWKVIAADSTPGFDFDAVYQKYRSEYRIPELFDELVGHLKQIVASGEVDSVRAVRELNKIIATLQNSRTGSLLSTRGAWYFVATWFKNTGWELLGSIPVAGPVAKGLRKTLDETNSSMEKLHDSMQSDLETMIAVDFPRLEYKPPELPKIEGPAATEGDDVVETDPSIAT